MSNNLIPFSQDDDDNLPAYLQTTFGEVANDELASGVASSYPIIGYRGKVWSITQGGDREVLTRPGDDDAPAPYIDVVIVKANPALSKVFYEGGYVEGSTDKPTCYSNDGVAPASDATEPQNKVCATCPRNIWGSRITENGSKGKECADSRRLAVVPGGELDRAMLLRVPAASLRELANYAEMLKRRKAPYQAVVTRIGFDRDVAHPQFTFKAVRWLSQEEAQEVAMLMHEDVVHQITGISVSDTAAVNSAAIGTIVRTTRASVGDEEVAAVLSGGGSSPRERKPNLAVVADVEGALQDDEAPAPKKPATKKAAPRKAKEADKPKSSEKVAELIEDVDSELDELLAGHFDD